MTDTTYADVLVKNSTLPKLHTQDECDWCRIPTPAEYLKLLKGKYFCLTPDQIETVSDWSLKTTEVCKVGDKQRLEDNKKLLREQCLLESWEYEFPMELYKHKRQRIDENFIRATITKCQKKTFDRNQPNMSIELANGLSSEGWTDLWQNIDLSQVLLFNWLWDLLGKEEKAKEEALKKSYEDANFVSKIIGWY